MFNIRPFSRGDVALLADLLHRTHQHDPSFDALEEDALIEFLDQECNRGGRDFYLAQHNDETVGALLSGRFEVSDRVLPVRGFRIIVAPEVRGHGLGSMLLERLEAQDPPQSVIRRSVLSEDWPSARAMLTRTGFREIRQALIMQRTGLPQEVPHSPEGLTFRDAHLPEEAAALTALYNVANRKAFGFAPLNTDELMDTVDTPGGRFMVLEEEEGVLIGSIQTLPYVKGVGVIFAVQVSPHRHRRGLGRFLVVAAINALAQQGFRAVELAVDASNAPAVALYGSLGFEIVRRDLTYEQQMDS